MSDRPTIVVADDESHVTHILSMKLGAAGFTVFVAHDGEEALALAREHRPDLVVTDFDMPFMRGDELGIALQADPQTAGTPLFMLTARGHKLPEDRRAQANIVLLMDKPFSAIALTDAIRRRLDLEPLVPTADPGSHI